MTDGGRVIGRYRLGREVGRGGMAVVYLARQIDLDRDVALKQLAGPAADEPEFAARFLREARIAGSLSHSNIVTVYEYLEFEGVPYIAMEYMPRGSLRPFMGRLPLAQVAGVLEAILAALAYAAPKGIVHRDLKPENLMLSAEGSVQVADFGIAKALNAASHTYATQEGTTIGTPTYMSPEQATAKGVGPSSDLYATGVIAYEMLLGRVPFPTTETPVAVLMAHVSDPPPPPLSVDPTLDPALAAWLERLLAKKPADRPESAAAAWEELEEVVIRLLGPMWRRDARIVDVSAAQPQPKPLTPAEFGAQQAEIEGAPETDGFSTYMPPPDVRPPEEPTPQEPPPPPQQPPPPPQQPPPPPPPSPPEPSPVDEPTQPAAAPPTGPTEELPPQSEPSDGGGGSRRTPLLIGAGALAVVAAVLIGVFALGGGGGDGDDSSTVPATTAVTPTTEAAVPVTRPGGPWIASTSSTLFASDPAGRLIPAGGATPAEGPSVSSAGQPVRVGAAAGRVYLLTDTGVQVFSAEDLSSLGTVAFPDGVAVFAQPDGALVASASQSSGRVCMIEVATLGACADLDFAPTGLGADGERVLVADGPKGQVLQLIRSETAIVADGRLNVGSGVGGRVFVADGRLLAPVAAGVAIVESGGTGAGRVVRLPEAPTDIGLVPETGTVWATQSNAGGVAVIDIASGTVQNVATAAKPVSLARWRPSGNVAIRIAVLHAGGTLVDIDSSSVSELSRTALSLGGGDAAG